MGWVRLDDAFYDHRKFAQVGPIGIACFAVGLAYANRNLTNGFISTRAAKTLVDCEGLGIVSGMSGRDAESLDGAGELVDAGLWEEVDGGYVIHDYLEYQPSADQVRAQREKNAIRQQAWRDKRTDGVSNDSSNDVSNAVTDGVTDTVTNKPVTGAPNPNPNPSKNSTAGAKRAQRIKEDWKPTDADVRWARTEGYDDLTQRRETEKFVDHWVSASGQAASKHDWSRAWKNWMRNVRKAPKSPAAHESPEFKFGMG